MGELNELQLKRSIKERKFSPLYLLYGEEMYTKKFYCESIIKSAVEPELRDFNYHFLDGAQTSLDDIYAQDLNMPMMSEYSCVYVEDYPFDKMSKSDLKKFGELLSDLNENCILIFYDAQGIFNGKVSAKAREACKLISENGSVINFKRKTAGDIAKILVRGCKDRGCDMSYATANYLVTCSGDDLNTLLNEIEKLCAFAGNREIVKSDIDLICTKTLDAKVFDLSAAILRRESARCFEIIESLYEQKEKPESIIGALSSNYINYYRVKTALDSGHSPSTVAQFFDYKRNAWLLDKCASNARRMSLRCIEECLESLAQADIILKTTACDSRIVIEELVVKLMLSVSQ